MVSDSETILIVHFYKTFYIKLDFDVHRLQMQFLFLIKTVFIIHREYETSPSKSSCGVLYHAERIGVFN